MGQSCCAGTRILVQDSVYDKFVDLFVKATEAYKVGNPADPETFQGPQVSKLQFEKILGYIEEGKKGGAKVLTGGGRLGTRGYYVKPTVFGDVTNDMKIAREEIFGPVASLIRFKTEEEAIKIANDTEVSGRLPFIETQDSWQYGLGAAVHSTNYNRINRVTRALKSGTVWINQVRLLTSQIESHADVKVHLVESSSPLWRIQAKWVGTRVGSRWTQHVSRYKVGAPLLRREL